MGHVLRRVGTGLWALLAALIVAVVAVVGLARLDAQDPVRTGPLMTFVRFVPLQESRRVLVVDVRDSDSFDRGHIPGSIHVPVREVGARVGEVRHAAKGRLVITYCSCPSEATSLAAARVLTDAGVSASALVGGFPRWVEFGGAVERR
jgi:rhodanese-related sulfurtransferase